MSPLAVASYNFQNVTDSGGNPIPVGPGTTLNAGDIVVNSGTGGSALNGVVNTADTVSGDSGIVTATGDKFAGSQAVNFDGGGTSIDVPSQIVDQSGTGTWTMSTWLNTTLAGSAFLSKNNGADTFAVGNSTFYLGNNPPNNNATLGTFPTGVMNSGGWLQGNQAVDDGSWHMLTFVDNGGTKSVYVDGVAVALNINGFTNTDTSNFVRIGFNADIFSAVDGNQNLAGSLDDLNFYSGALNAAQVLQLFNTNTVGTVQTQYLPATTAVNITASGAALNINGQQQSIGSLAGVAGSQVQLGSGLLVVVGVSTSTTFCRRYLLVPVDLSNRTGRVPWP